MLLKMLIFWYVTVFLGEEFLTWRITVPLSSGLSSWRMATWLRRWRHYDIQNPPNNSVISQKTCTLSNTNISVVTTANFNNVLIQCWNVSFYVLPKWLQYLNGCPTLYYVFWNTHIKKLITELLALIFTIPKHHCRSSDLYFLHGHLTARAYVCVCVHIFS
jgi:hypothetical protein